MAAEIFWDLVILPKSMFPSLVCEITQSHRFQNLHHSDDVILNILQIVGHRCAGVAVVIGLDFTGTQRYSMYFRCLRLQMYFLEWITIIISIFRLGCCPCPIQWGWETMNENKHILIQLWLFNVNKFKLIQIYMKFLPKDSIDYR